MYVSGDDIPLAAHIRPDHARRHDLPHRRSGDYSRRLSRLAWCGTQRCFSFPLALALMALGPHMRSGLGRLYVAAGHEAPISAMCAQLILHAWCLLPVVKGIFRRIHYLLYFFNDALTTETSPFARPRALPN